MAYSCLPLQSSPIRIAGMVVFALFLLLAGVSGRVALDAVGGADYLAAASAAGLTVLSLEMCRQVRRALARI
jgi:hypothetical protein